MLIQELLMLTEAKKEVHSDIKALAAKMLGIPKSDVAFEQYEGAPRIFSYPRRGKSQTVLVPSKHGAAEFSLILGSTSHGGTKIPYVWGNYDEDSTMGHQQQGAYFDKKYKKVVNASGSEEPDRDTQANLDSLQHAAYDYIDKHPLHKKFDKEKDDLHKKLHGIVSRGGWETFDDKAKTLDRATYRKKMRQLKAKHKSESSKLDIDAIVKAFKRTKRDEVDSMSDEQIKNAIQHAIKTAHESEPGKV